MIQTNHSAILDITKQSSIVSISSTMRINVCLVRVSQFLRQFNLDVRHKPGKEHIVPDALLCLASANHGKKTAEYSELDALYTCSLVGISDDFRSRLIEGYKKDPWFRRLLQQIDDNKDLGKDAVPLPFIRGKYFSSRLEISDPDASTLPAESKLAQESSLDSAASALQTPLGDADLVYNIDRITSHQRLCIPPSLIKEIFQLAHSNSHPSFQRCYKIIAASWYI